MRKFLLIFISVLLSFCSSNEDLIPLSNSKSEKIINLLYPLTINKNNEEKVSLDIGVWMFKRNELDVNSIADWLGIRFDGKVLLEPINIIWVDFVSKNKEEAEQKVLTYLEKNNFLHRSGSSTGYLGIFENNYWLHQYRETWSDKLDPNTVNNHGRIFLGYETFSNLGNSVFVSTGAFSVENEKHHFISFEKSLWQFHETEFWKVNSEVTTLKNIVKNDTYSTFDHNRVRTFILK